MGIAPPPPPPIALAAATFRYTPTQEIFAASSLFSDADAATAFVIQASEMFQMKADNEVGPYKVIACDDSMTAPKRHMLALVHTELKSFLDRLKELCVRFARSLFVFVCVRACARECVRVCACACRGGAGWGGAGRGQCPQQLSSPTATRQMATAAKPPPEHRNTGHPHPRPKNPNDPGKPAHNKILPPKQTNLRTSHTPQ